MPERVFFEDFAAGQTQELGGLPVSAEDIVAYASVFDAQDFHIDAEKAKASFVGTLIASGWHTSAIMMRLMADGFLNGSAGLGAPGIEELKWLKPVRPGDVLSVRSLVEETKESRSRPDIGLVRFRFTVSNQRGEAVQEVLNWIIFGRRGHHEPSAFRAEPAPPRYAMPADAGRVLPPAEGPGPVVRLRDMEVGRRIELGSFEFTAADIIAFARAFDPQRFHLDEAEAKASLFGGLCASGWHTAGAWMRLMVEHRRRVEAEMGAEAPALGPSPGFKNLKWLKPVFAGDVISYSHTLTGKRESASRPGWGMAAHRNEGRNQKGELVFAFDGNVFWSW